MKARIVAETLMPGVKVCEVAVRHGVAPQYLTMWRKLARQGRLTLAADASTSFVPLIVADAPGPRSPVGASAPIELEVAGVIVRLPGDVSPARIGEIASVLRRS